MDKHEEQGNFETSFDIILNQFEASIEALQYQDVHSSEKSLVIAKNAYKSIISIDSNTDDLRFLSLFVKFIEVITATLKAIFLQLESRYDKADSEMRKALDICHSEKESLLILKERNYDIEAFEDLFSFFFIYFEILLTASLKTLSSVRAKENGKYVDNVGVRKECLAIYRKINDFTIDVNSPNSEIIFGLAGLLNKIADTTELQIEKLIENNKTISFAEPIDNQLFLIHGHEVDLARNFKTLLKNRFNIEPIILIDEPSKGMTVIEKLEEYGMNCAFAFAILTPDDLVENKGKEYFQARPNVLFELGWFIGRYGREKVRIIKKRGTNLPSDFGGLLTLNFAENIDEVFLKVEKELIDLELIQG